MSTNFPSSLDTFTNPTSGDAENSVLVPHATQHANINDSMFAVETKLGVDGSAVATTIDYLLKNAASLNPGHLHSVSSFSGFNVTSPSSGQLLTHNGTSWVNSFPKGFLFQQTQTARAASGETDLYSVIIPANTFVTNGDVLDITIFGKFVSNGNQKAFALYFAGTKIYDSSLITASGGVWTVHTIIARTAASSSIAMVSVSMEMNDAVGLSNSLISLFSTHSSGNIFKVTGTAPSANGDITAEFWKGKLYYHTDGSITTSVSIV